MIVSMWMTRDVVTVDTTMTITAAGALMATKGIRRLPVVDRHVDGLHLIGIVSASDLYRAFPAHVNPFGVTAPDTYHSSTTVEQVMKRGPITTTPGTPIEEPARLMRNHKIGALPVVENGVLVGLITESDIFRAFVGLFESPPGSVRITFDTTKSEDTFGLIAKLAGPRKVRILSLISSQYHEQPVYVVRAVGGAMDEFLDDIWKTGHHVLNVLRIP